MKNILKIMFFALAINIIFAGKIYAGIGGSGSESKKQTAPAKGKGGDGANINYSVVPRIIMVTTDSPNQKIEIPTEDEHGNKTTRTETIYGKRVAFLEAMVLYPQGKKDISNEILKSSNIDSSFSLQLDKKHNGDQLNEANFTTNGIDLKYLEDAIRNSEILSKNTWMNLPLNINKGLFKAAEKDGNKCYIFISSPMTKSEVKEYFNNKVSSNGFDISDYVKDINRPKTNRNIELYGTASKRKMAYCGFLSNVKYNRLKKWNKKKQIGKFKSDKAVTIFNKNINSQKNSIKSFNEECNKALGKIGSNGLLEFKNSIFLNRRYTPKVTVFSNGTSNVDLYKFYLNTSDFMPNGTPPPPPPEEDKRSNGRESIEQIYASGGTYNGILNKDESYYRSYEEIYKSPRYRASVNYESAKDEFKLNHNISFNIYYANQHYHSYCNKYYCTSWYTYSGGFDRQLSVEISYEEYPEEPDIETFKPINLGTEEEIDDNLCNKYGIDTEDKVVDIEVRNLNPPTIKENNFVETLANNQPKDFKIEFNNNQLGIPQSKNYKILKDEPIESSLKSKKNYYYNLHSHFDLKFKPNTQPRYSILFNNIEYKEGESIPDVGWGYKGGTYKFRAIKPGQYYTGHNFSGQYRPFWYVTYTAMKPTKIGFKYRVSANTSMKTSDDLDVETQETEKYLYKKYKNVKQDILFMPFNVKTSGGYSK